MKEEKLIKALKEMDKKRVEELESNSRKLFDAIMKIADERDRLLEENQQLKEQLQNKQDIINGILDYIDSNKFVEEFKNVVNERNVRNEILMIIEKSDK